MLAAFIGKLLTQAYNMETNMKRRSKEAHALQSPLYRQRVKTTKKHPYYDAKEVIGNDFSHEGLTPVGYYIEETVEDE
jgi:hypothetical protein|tara:strand:+ start:243 stop:476 length:234 start_codon:yes stop_codon:yes gene_type:complete